MTHVDWHPYPETKPKKSGKFLVTLSGDTEKDEPIVTAREYKAKLEMFLPKWRHDVIAWAELPEPYIPEVNND